MSSLGTTGIKNLQKVQKLQSQVARIVTNGPSVMVVILAFSKPNSRNFAFSELVWPRKFNLA